MKTPRSLPLLSRLFALACMILLPALLADTRYVKLSVSSQQYSTNLTIGTNQLAVLLDLNSHGSFASGYPLRVTFKDRESGYSFPDRAIGSVILGPATVELSGMPISFSAYAIVEVRDVNQSAASPQGTAVQPAGYSGTIALETSTDLRAWKPAAPGELPAGDENRFYRMKLELATPGN